MVAAAELPLQNQSGALGSVQPGAAFWIDPDYVPGLVASGQASVAPASTPYPRPLPHMVRGVPGLGAATANSSP